MTSRHHLTLSADEIAALQHVVRTGSTTQARRAQIILLTGEEMPQVTIAAEIGLSERQVRRWQRAFEAQRLGIFPALAAADEAQDETPALAGPTDEQPKQDQGVVVVPALPGIDEPRRALLLRKKPGVEPGDPMAEAGRKILHFHFERMLLHEPGSRLGEDIEALHDMRVATRRMRSALDVFGSFYQDKALRAIRRGLRDAGRALGSVRDMDVFIEKLGHYQETLPEAASLDPLIEVCIARRDAARQKLIVHLDSAEFEQFVTTFEAFLTTPGAGAKPIDRAQPSPYQVRHIVPRFVYTRYEAVRAYEPILDQASIETLHALRIDFKRLRYTLEFFAEVLGPEGITVIEDVKALQDHLGDLNDAEVAGHFLREFVTHYEESQTGVLLRERRSIEGVVQYLAHQYAAKHRLVTTFPQAWAYFNRDEMRRNLALAVSTL
ncbi:MAG: CHAD domain-containing protein [Anaerolineae bacterium]|nr:CHAD domain-containing protein [Anaerolineae bacterium]